MDLLYNSFMYAMYINVVSSLKKIEFYVRITFTVVDVITTRC